jgi:ribosomal protein L9
MKLLKKLKKLLKKLKQLLRKAFRVSTDTALRDLEATRQKLLRAVQDAQAEHRALHEEIDDLYDKIEVLAQRKIAEIHESARAARVADRINELLK